MNYTTITIKDQKIGLKFGMASFRYLSDKFIDGIAFQNDELNEIGISHILYGGYYNNCLVKGTDATLTFEDFVDYIELNISNDEFLIELKSIISIWSSSDFIKKTQEVALDKNPKKKTTRGKK
jgi:hypothetical protein